MCKHTGRKLTVYMSGDSQGFVFDTPAEIHLGLSKMKEMNDNVWVTIIDKIHMEKWEEIELLGLELNTTYLQYVEHMILGGYNIIVNEYVRVLRHIYTGSFTIPTRVVLSKATCQHKMKSTTTSDKVEVSGKVKKEKCGTIQRYLCKHSHTVSLSAGCMDPTENWFCPDCKTLSLDKWYRGYSPKAIKKEFADIFKQHKVKVVFQKD